MAEKRIIDLLKKTVLVLSEREGLIKQADEKKLIAELKEVIQKETDELDSFFEFLEKNV